MRTRFTAKTTTDPKTEEFQRKKDPKLIGTKVHKQSEQCTPRESPNTQQMVWHAVQEPERLTKSTEKSFLEVGQLNRMLHEIKMDIIYELRNQSSKC